MRHDLRLVPSFILALTWAAFVLASPAHSEPLSEPPPRIYPNAESVEPRVVGARLPSAPLRNLDGESVDLAKLVSETGALLVFYRGGW